MICRVCHRPVKMNGEPIRKFVIKGTCSDMTGTCVECKGIERTRNQERMLKGVKRGKR